MSHTQRQRCRRRRCVLYSIFEAHTHTHRQFVFCVCEAHARGLGFYATLSIHTQRTTFEYKGVHFFQYKNFINLMRTVLCVFNQCDANRSYLMAVVVEIRLSHAVHVVNVSPAAFITYCYILRVVAVLSSAMSGMA